MFTNLVDLFAIVREWEIVLPGSRPAVPARGSARAGGQALVGFGELVVVELASVVAIPLVIITRRICGKAAVQGVTHAALAGLAAGAVGAAVGVTLSMAVPEQHKLEAFALALSGPAARSSRSASSRTSSTTVTSGPSWRGCGG